MQMIMLWKITHINEETNVKLIGCGRTTSGQKHCKSFCKIDCTLAFAHKFVIFNARKMS